MQSRFRRRQQQGPRHHNQRFSVLSSKKLAKRSIKTSPRRKAQRVTITRNAFLSTSAQPLASDQQLTMDQRKMWYNNKMRPIVTKTMQVLLSQFQLAQPDVSKSATDAIRDAIVAHQLIVPIDSPLHPYKHANNKQTLIIDMIEKAFIPLGVLPRHYHTKWRLGTIPPIEFNGQFQTDTYDLSSLSGLDDASQSSLNEVTTVADMIAMVLTASGFKDIPETDQEWANTQHPPPNEDHTTDFSHNKIKLFHPDNKEEFQSESHKFIRSELAAIQADLAEPSLDVLDTYSTQYSRKDITQLFLTHYAGGRFPSIEVYKSFLMQQAAQTVLHEQYMYNNFGRNLKDQPDMTSDDGQRNIQIHYHTIAGEMSEFAKQAEVAQKAKEQQDLAIFNNVQQSMPIHSYPKLEIQHQKQPPSPPHAFLASIGPPKHRIEAIDIKNQADYPNRAQFRPILYNPAHTVSALRELFLQHFRHDITTYYNFTSNDLLHKFKTEPLHSSFSHDDLNQLRLIVEELYAQNQLDNKFKEVYTTGKLQKIKRELIPGSDGTIDHSPTDAEIAGDNAIYQHILAKNYSPFAQKCYQLLVKECNEHIETTHTDLSRKLDQQKQQSLEEKM